MLRIVGLMGLLALLPMFVAGCGAGSEARADQPAHGTKPYSFRVKFDGEVAIEDWRAIELAGQASSFTDQFDAARGVRTSSPDGAEPLTMTMHMLFDPKTDQAVRDWMKATYDGEDIRKTISVEVVDQSGATVRTLNFFECFPVRFYLTGLNDEPGEVLSWTLEVRVNRIEMA